MIEGLRDRNPDWFIALSTMTNSGQEMARERLENFLSVSIEELKNNQERLNQVLNSAGEGICSLDAEGRITFANQAATRMTGWKFAVLIGRPMHATLHQPPRKYAVPGK